MKRTPRILIGTDPEIFATHKGKQISAHDLVPGTKAEPHKLAFGAVQADGTAIEFNTKPAATPEQFQYYITRVMNQIRAMVPKEYEFKITPSVFFEPEYFRTLPEIATELGCTPDFNAWHGGSMNPKPIPRGKYEFMRTGAGHIHIGFTEGADVLSRSHIWDCNEIVKALDNVFGVYLKYFDNDPERAKLYGGPGAYRPKTYGVEYRRLSNAWLADKRLWKWVFNVSQYVTEQLMVGNVHMSAPIQPSIQNYVAYSHGGDPLEHTNAFMTRYLKGFPPFPLKVKTKVETRSTRKGSRTLSMTSIILEPAELRF